MEFEEYLMIGSSPF